MAGNLPAIVYVLRAPSVLVARSTQETQIMVQKVVSANEISSRKLGKGVFAFSIYVVLRELEVFFASVLRCHTSPTQDYAGDMTDCTIQLSFFLTAYILPLFICLFGLTLQFLNISA